MSRERPTRTALRHGATFARRCGICVATLWLSASASIPDHRPQPVRVFYESSSYGPDVPLPDIPEVSSRLRGGTLPGARLVVEKARHRMGLYVGEKLLKAYRIELGQGGLDPKTMQGDARTPEGEYYVCEHRQQSTYYKALLLSYPNEEDARRGLKAGLITHAEAKAIRQAVDRKRCPPQDTALGGWIMIHGQHPDLTQWIAESGRPCAPTGFCASYEPGDLIPAERAVGSDWTLGCVALTNPDIRELHALLPARTPVTIRGD